jgi:hypothetical protein
VQEWACEAQFSFAATTPTTRVKIAEAGVIEAVLAAMAVHWLDCAEQPRSASKLASGSSSDGVEDVTLTISSPHDMHLAICILHLLSTA